jgi:trimethylamine--corrinoid protein Co-methyltransferase
LAIDLINEVGPIPGFYLDKAHTRKWWKLEQFVPKAADRMTYPEWMMKGKKSALDYAKDRMEEILATHKPKPLAPEHEQAVEDALKDAREYYKKEGAISDEEWAIYMRSLGSPDYPHG